LLIDEYAMSEPIIFVSRNRIKAGVAEEFRKYYQSSIQPIFDSKPGTLAQLGYENEEGTEFIVIRVFPNADALDQQIRGADERSKKTYEYIEPTAIEIFGKPNPATLEKMKKIAGSGIMVSISPSYVGGFIR
jgi:hypothetical protein